MYLKPGPLLADLLLSILYLISTVSALYRRGLSRCSSMPTSFSRHWQVIGQKGRQIWIGKYHLRILGPIDDVFGKAAGGVRVRWYDINCDDDMVQIKAVISESKSKDIGEYMCLRLKRQENDILGFVVRETTRISKKLDIDCEYWGDGSRRHAYMFRLTDNPTWADLLATNEAFKQSNMSLEMKMCGSIPEGFHGDWKLTGSDKTVEFRAKYYRAYGAHGNDPFWRTNTEVTFYRLLCNPRRIVLRAYLWQLPVGSRSQLQCLTLNLDGGYNLNGHAVNMVASKPASNEPPELDCDHGVGNGYTSYPLHLTRQVDEVLSPRPIHNLAEHDQMEEALDFHEEHQKSGEHHHENAEKSGGQELVEPPQASQHKMPLLDFVHLDNHEGHDAEDIKDNDHHSLDESENRLVLHKASLVMTSRVVDFLTTTPGVAEDISGLPPSRHRRPEHSVAQYRPWLFPPWYRWSWQPRQPMYPPSGFNYEYPDYQWMGKRDYIPDKYKGSRQHSKHYNFNYLPDRYDDEHYKTVQDKSSPNQLLTAIMQQNALLEKTYSKLSEFIDPKLAITTGDKDYIPPYDIQNQKTDEEPGEDKLEIDKKTLEYLYFGD